MPLTTPGARHARRSDRPYNPRRVRTSFARQAVFAEFGVRFAKALDEADFIDRPPGQFPRPAPEARFR